MGSTEIFKKALKLKPHERLIIIEGLLQSLDEPDKNIDEIWAKEAEKRLSAYKEGKLKGIPIEEIFSDEDLK